MAMLPGKKETAFIFASRLRMKTDGIFVCEFFRSHKFQLDRTQMKCHEL